MKDKALSEPGRAQESGARNSARPLAEGLETVQHLRQTLERFQQESLTLLRGATNLEELVQHQEARYAELEQELNDTALLYVASYQLNSRREPKEVLRQIRELLEQLVGVEAFAVYMGGGEGNTLQPVASRGLATAELTPLRTNERPLADACIGRCAVLAEQAPLHAGTLTSPLAVIPLMLGERVLGAILVLKLFQHKVSWAHVDQQLFQLMSSHAASALVAAYLYQRHSDLPGALAGLGDSLK